jgi:hypothetical protein
VKSDLQIHCSQMDPELNSLEEEMKKKKRRWKW